MRIAHLNQAIIIAALAVTTGCFHKAPPEEPLGPMEETTQPSTAPVVTSTTEPTTQSAADTTTTAPDVPPIILTQTPATQSIIEGPATAPAVITPPAEPVTQPSTEPAAQATTEPSTAPATEPAAAAATEPPFNPAPPTTNPIEIQADAVMAERIAAMAQTTIPTKLPTPEIWPAVWKQVGALLTAANKLDPTEARFSRLLTDAMLQLRDNDGAIAALLATRKADPNDQFAQMQLVDLYTSRMDTADQKLNYLKDLLGRPSANENIRAHAGVAAAKLLLERGQDETARNVLAEALRLNPLSGEGLRLRYNMLPPNVSSFERAEALMAILKANPAQPEFAAALADQVAGIGLVQESLPWYDAALKLGMRQGHPDLNLALRTAAELFVAGDKQGSTNLTDQLIRVDPNNPANWFLKLVITRAAGNKDDVAKVMQQAMNVMSNRVVEVINSAGNSSDAPATTRPITTEGPYPLPDLGLTVSRINQGGSSELRNAFISAVTDLATLGVYFAQDAEMSAKLIARLKAVVPDDSPTLARLQGWNYLIQGKRDEAKVKLSAIAAQDPLAELGLVRLTAMNPDDKQTAASMGRKLIADYPSGLIAALLWDGLQDLNPKIIPGNQADALKEELDRFPKDWLKITDTPQGFYSLRAEPLAVARSYSEPLLARLTIQNLTDSDLTLGPDGIIKQDLWFNAQIKGIVEQTFGGTAYDRIAGPLVLKGRQHTSQIVRLDQGVLQQFITSEPRVALEVYGSVLTNPVPAPGGAIASGPAGYGVQFTRVFDRAAAPVDGPAPRKAMDDLSTGNPAQKITAMNLLSAYVQLIRAAKDSNDSTRQVATLFTDAINKVQNDPVPAVSAWAGYVSAVLSDVAHRQNIIHDLAQDPDWRHRLVSLLAIDGIPATTQKEIAAGLSSDPEPSVRASARARLFFLDIMSKMPATQSTTQPVATP